MNNNNNSNNPHDSITCPVCLTPFDADQHTPKIFPTCGHTVCEECLVQVLKMNTPKCPLDKIKFGYDFRSIEAFPTNFLGKELLQKHSKWTKCTTHGEKNNLICLTDQSLICTDCVILGDHQGHDVKLLSEAQDLASIKINQLSGLLEEITNHQSQLDTSIGKIGGFVQEAIKERFNHLRLAIDRHEAQMLFQFEKMFQEEKFMLKSGKLGENSSDISQKLEEFSKSISTPEILKMLEEDYKDLEKEITETFNLNIKKMEESANLLSAFVKYLPKKDLLKDLDVTELLDQSLAEFNQNRKFGSEKQEASKEIEIESEVNFSLADDQVLKVFYNKSAAKQLSKFERAKLEQTRKIEYEINFPTQEAVDIILSSLFGVLKFLPNVKSVSFFVEDRYGTPEIEADKAFHKIMSATLSRPENLQNISFAFHTSVNYVIGDLSFLFLTENVLPKIKNLSTFSFQMITTKISGQVLKALAQINWKAWPNLEHFTLDIPGLSFEETDLLKFLDVVPNVKDLTLGFGNSQLTDSALEDFSTKILPFLDKLERFEVGFYRTKLTIIGVEKFLMNIPKVKRLLIGLGKVKLTDNLVKDFFEKRESLMMSLQEFRLEANACDLSRSVLRQIDEWENRIDQDNENGGSPKYTIYQTWRMPGNSL